MSNLQRTKHQHTNWTRLLVLEAVKTRRNEGTYTTIAAAAKINAGPCKIYLDELKQMGLVQLFANDWHTYYMLTAKGYETLTHFAAIKDALVEVNGELAAIVI